MEHHPTGADRRTVIQAVGVAALCAPTLGACARRGEGSAASTGADGAVRLKADDVEVGSAVYYRDAKLILSRPGESEFVVFDATCPHQGCMVSAVQGDQLVCPCHSSIFDAASGDVVSGPAATGLTVVPSTVEGDEIVISG